MNPTTSAGSWALEVVRGKQVGRTYALNGGAIVLGNDLGGAAGIDLSEQEGNSPKRMAPRQARLEWARGGLVLRDLDSPGGTFVNRQRLISGQARPLLEGDILQLGGVQLRVVGRPAAKGPAPRPPAPPPSPRPASPVARGPIAYALPSGTVCRSWDDFLTVSAQKWGELREELTSGRLASSLIAQGRSDQAPSPKAPGTPDERLDAWIGSLPTTRPSLPEIDVHPDRLSIKATGGGTTRRKLHVANAGYRLLRGTARVEPAGCHWLALASEFAGRPFVTVEGLDLALDVTMPDRIEGSLSATLFIESNGGTRRVAVTLEPPSAADAIPEPTGAMIEPVDWGIRERLAPVSVRNRILITAVTLGILRLVIALVGRWTGLGDGLPAAALPLALLGGWAGAVLALRRKSLADLPATIFAGAFVGVLAAAAYFAACRSIEPIMGSTLSSWAPVVTGLWAGIGAAIGAVSTWFVPHSAAPEVLS